MEAYYRLFSVCNYSVQLFVDRNYSEFLKEAGDYNFHYTDEDVKIPDILFIFNLSIEDHKIVKKFKSANPSMKTFFVYHEPWLGYSKWFTDMIRQNESLKDSIRAYGRWVFVKDVLRKSERIILPSDMACEYYKRNCIKYNPNYTFFPLVFTDEAKDFQAYKKEYFSFIATASESKNFELFVKYIKHRAENDEQALFQIVTRSDISGFIDNSLKKLVDEKRLILKYGKPLSNAEINEAYARSNCTWLLYKRSTQSGVLCKSFMFGAPGIASDLGSFGEFIDGRNGIILGDNYNFQDIDKAYDKIKSENSEYSKGARETFLKAFCWENKINEFKEIISEI
ncbi:MAG: glycosyltransferase [Bacteroides sp.]|nr:glycosyltransferase [Bacteroides sp.]